MKENGLLENYTMEDLYFKDYPQPGIMQIAIWLKRKECKKLYPECEIEILHYEDFIRIIAHEPAEKESFTLYSEDYAEEVDFLASIKKLEDFLKEKYPNRKIIKEQVPLGVRIVVKNEPR